MELETATNSTNTENPSTNDVAQLIIGVDEKSLAYRRRRRCCVVFAVIIVMVVVVVSTVVLYYIFGRDSRVCKSSLCFNISRTISNQLNTSVDPCEDFYSYACGGFFKEHKLSNKVGEITSLSIVRWENLKVLRHALENDARYSQSSSIIKTAKIYDSCIKISAINSRGATPLTRLIKQYGGWSLTGGGMNSWSIEEKMGHVLRDLNVQTLLSVTVGPNLWDSTRNTLAFGTSSLGMPARNFLSDEYKEIQEAYKTYMKTVVRLLGGSRPAEERMMQIYAFEKKLANAGNRNYYSEDLAEILQLYHRSRRSFDELNNTIHDFCEASFFNRSFILRFLNTAFADQKFTPFNVYEKVFYVGDYEGIYLAYSDTPDDLIKDYITWQVVSKYIYGMSQSFVDAKRKFETARFGPRESERWRDCLEGMMTAMDMSLGRLFVDVDFDEATKNTVKDMTRRIRAAFTNNLKTADWMDESTKESAKEKVNAMAEDIGYPPFIKNDAELDQYYSMLTVDDAFFENVVAINKMMIQRQFGRLRLQVNKDRWLMGPAIINAYYSFQQNRIVILAGILRSPFYKKNYPNYFNYGSLAAIIGHETTHGFDDEGRNFDKNGNLRDWWSSNATLKFKERSKCLVNQYSNYTVFGKNIDGEKTLDENIADNGGIKLAYEAYQSWVNDNGVEGTLPDLGFSNDQLFFIGLAMPWCSLYNRERALFQLRTDVHSIDKFRVIGPLSNFEKFAQSFKCSVGTTMNPATKCAVW